MILKYKIENEGITIKAYLKELGFPDQLLKDIRKGNGQLLVNDQAVAYHYILKKNDLLEIVTPISSLEEDGVEHVLSVMGDLDILYEDAYILILNKPANIATIPTREHYDHSLANYVMSYYKRTGIESGIHFVSRLDAPTSGIIMLAKNSYVTYLLQNTLIVKRYLLELDKVLETKEGLIEGRIEKDPESIIKRKMVDGESNTKTVFKVIDEVNNHSIVEALLCTGKTHQLRVHFSTMGYPIIGDELYGKASDDGILHLHSYDLIFKHPITKEEIHITSYPDWYRK